MEFKKWRRKTIRKVSGWLRNHPFVWFSAVVILIPLIVTLLYNIHIVDHRALAPESVLSYCGVALGIGFSFYQLLFQKEKESQESRNRRRPFVSLEVKKENGIFELELTNLGTGRYVDVYLFDEYVSSCLVPDQQLNLLVGESEKSTNVINASSLSGWDDGVNAEGFPKEIVFYLHDVFDMQWVVTFYRSRNGSSTVYFADVREGIL